MKATTIRKAGAAALAGAMAFSCASCALFGPNKKEIVEAAMWSPVYIISKYAILTVQLSCMTTVTFTDIRE